MKLKLLKEDILALDTDLSIIRDPLNYLVAGDSLGNEFIHVLWNPITDILLQLHIIVTNQDKKQWL